MKIKHEDWLLVTHLPEFPPSTSKPSTPASRPPVSSRYGRFAIEDEEEDEYNGMKSLADCLNELIHWKKEEEEVDVLDNKKKNTNETGKHPLSDIAFLVEEAEKGEGGGEEDQSLQDGPRKAGEKDKAKIFHVHKVNICRGILR